MRSLFLGLGTFCVLFGLFILFYLPTSIITGVNGVAITGIGIIYIVKGVKK